MEFNKKTKEIKLYWRNNLQIIITITNMKPLIGQYIYY